MPKLFILLFLCSSFTYGQNHYWSQQYGAINTLIGGSNVAEVRDNASIFYNPGASGFIDHNKISVSANIYEAQFVNLKNGLGNGNDAKSFRALIYPQFVGGSIVVKKVPKLKIMYGSLVRNRASLRFSVSSEGFDEVIPLSVGKEFYKSFYQHEFNTTETWAGIGFGYKINKNFASGLSFFGSYSNYENISRVSSSLDAFYSNIPYVASVSENSSTRFDHVNFILKTGLAAEFNNLKLGLSITLPSIKVWGKGSLTKSFETQNLHYHATDTSALYYRNATFLISDEQRSLKSNYRIPASFALGGAYQFKKILFRLSTEIFLGISEYTVIQGDNQARIRPTALYGNDVVKDFLQVKTKVSPVVNVSAGLIYKVKDNLKLLTGFRTDFNNNVNFTSNSFAESYGSISPFQWHLLHFSGGASYFRGSSDITFGLNYSFGIKAQQNNMITLSEPRQDFLLRGLPNQDSKANIHNIGLVIGYTYFFRRSPKSSETKDENSQIAW